jgi:hypothetical protein
VSCFTTIFICTWVTQHRAIPREHEPSYITFFRSVGWMCAGIIAPEYICLVAIMQCSGAWRLKKMMHDASGGHFGFLQGFFLQIGGLARHTIEGKRVVISPDQYMYLVEQGLIPWNGDPDGTWSMSKEAIMDKAKTDSFAKIFTAFQVTSFVIQCVAKLASHLPLCPLEVATLGFVFCSLASFGFWWHKPENVDLPFIVVMPKLTTEQQTAFDEKDFEEKLLDKADTIYFYSTDSDELFSAAMGALVSIGFAAIHIAGWNLVFPSRAELVIWRISALGTIGVSAFIMIIGAVDQALKLHFKLVGFVFPFIYFFYIGCRLLVVGETLASLRALPAGVYQTIVLSNYIFAFQ